MNNYLSALRKSDFLSGKYLPAISVTALFSLLFIVAGLPVGVLAVLILIAAAAYITYRGVRAAHSRDLLASAPFSISVDEDSRSPIEAPSSPESDEEEQIDEERTADTFLFDQLRALKMKPMADGDTIIFEYKGGCFRAQWLDKHVIRLSFPCLLSVDAGCQNHLCRLLNTINSQFVLLKMVMVAADGDSNLLVHAVADIYYTSKNAATEGYLTDVLTLFHNARLALMDGLYALGEMEETPALEDRNDYFGFSLN